LAIPPQAASDEQVEKSTDLAEVVELVLALDALPQALSNTAVAPAMANPTFIAFIVLLSIFRRVPGQLLVLCNLTLCM
jgi:hypothetical protein